MELHQLEAFSAVMSVGSITGAGRLLERSQPAVTRQIQELEADLGYLLFHRSGPRVTPTNEAFLLYEEVERSLVGMRTIAQRARAIGNGEARPVVVAATAALATSIVPEALHRATTASMDASHCTSLDTVSDRPAHSPSFPLLQLRTQSAEHVVHTVLTDHADIGLTTLPVAHEGLQVQWIAAAPCVLAMHPAHKLAGMDSISLASLKDVGIATVANLHRLRHRIDIAFKRAGIRPDVRLETNHAANALAAARAGSLVAIIDPATAVGQDGTGIRIRPLNEAIPFLFAVVTRAGRPLPLAVQCLLSALRDSAAAVLTDLTFHSADQHDALLQQTSPPTRRRDRRRETGSAYEGHPSPAREQRTPEWT